MATLPGIQAKTPTMQYWCNRFEDGESLDDLTSRLEALYQKKLAEADIDDDNPIQENKVKKWFETTITEAINAKEDYYANSVSGQISSFFQWLAAALFGCAGYTTSLQHAKSFLLTVQGPLNFEYQNFAPIEEQHPRASSRNEFFHPSFLEVSLFCELHQAKMLEVAKSENKAQYLKIPGQENTSIYAMPDGNCYLVFIDPILVGTKDPNYIAKGATKEVFRAYDLVNKKTVAFMRSIEDINPSYPPNFPLVKNEYAALQRFNGVSGILQVRNGFVQNGRVAFFSDYYEEKSLSHFLNLGRNQTEARELSPMQELHLMFKILEGAESIHNKGYLHRDFKDANILIQKEEINGEEMYEPVLIDFDCCCEKGDRSSLEIGVATPNFWSPEYAREMSLKVPIRSLAEVSTYQMDIWALGVVLYHIHYRKETPWELRGPGAAKYLANLKDDWFDQPTQDDKIGEVIKGMLQVDPSKRMSLAQALLTLEEIEAKLGQLR